MSTSRILNPPRTVDPYYHQAERMAETERRLALLESGANAKIEKFARAATAVASVGLLDDFDGNSITGLRITGTGFISGLSGTGFGRLRFNGATSFPTNAVGDSIYLAGAGYPVTGPVGTFGGAITTSGGLAVLNLANYAIAGHDVIFTGVLSTRVGAVRAWLGETVTIARTPADTNLMVRERFTSRWHDNTTPATSLSFVMDNGTFTGRIAVEVLP